MHIKNCFLPLQFNIIIKVILYTISYEIYLFHIFNIYSKKNNNNNN